MTRFQRFLKTLTALVVVCCAYNVQTASAAGLPPAAAHNPIVVYTQIAATAFGEGPGAALLSRVREARTLRVIVGLGFDMLPSHQLSEADTVTQTTNLSALQDAVLGAALGTRRDGVISQFQDIPYMTLEVDEHQLHRLLSDPRVLTIQEDGIAALMLKASTKVIRVNRLWKTKIDLRGAGQTIAILDTGSHHTKMIRKDRIVAGGCYSSNYAPYSAESLCPGGAEVKTNKASGKNCSVSIRGCDHGTHVATIAAGDSGRLKGVARESNVIRMQVFTKFTNPAYCGAVTPCIMSFTSDQVKALERVYRLRKKYNIAAVNMSLGGGYYTSHCDSLQPAMSEIINRLSDAGVAVVIASGNSGMDGYISSPACINNAVAVGSVTKTDGLSNFSNHSSLIDLLAPGDSIYAGLPSRSYGYKSGTSMAAPHVAGAIALLKGYRPNATVAELVTALECTGEPVARAGISKRRIDVRSAYKFLKRNKTGCDM